MTGCDTTLAGLPWIPTPALAMRKMLLACLLGCGMVASTVVSATLLSLCVLNSSLHLDFGPGNHGRAISHFGTMSYPAPSNLPSVGIGDYSSGSSVYFNSHVAQLPFSLLKLLLLFMASLSLVAIGYLLRTLLRLYRRTRAIP